MSLKFDKPITLESAIRSLQSRDPYTGSTFKVQHNPSLVTRLLGRKGDYLDEGVDTAAYDIIGVPDKVMLVTTGSGDRYAKSHALKVIQLALAGVLYGHGYANGTAVLVTLRTLSVMDMDWHYNGNNPYSGRLFKMAFDIAGTPQEYSLEHFIHVMRRVLKTPNVNPRLVDAASQFIRVTQAFKRVPGLYAYADDCAYDIHAGNWRVKPDGTIYLADGFC